MKTHFLGLRLMAVSLLLYGFAFNSQAQSSKTDKLTLTAMVQGHTVTGERFDLTHYKGKVVLAYFWGTDCPVCVDMMNEIRINTAGWKDQPFVTVAINLNKNRADFDGYTHMLRRMSQDQSKVIHMYGGDSYYKDNLGAKPRLPAAFVFDTSGKVAGKYQGRIPADAWNQIAELLP